MRFGWAINLIFGRYQFRASARDPAGKWQEWSGDDNLLSISEDNVPEKTRAKAHEIRNSLHGIKEKTHAVVPISLLNEVQNQLSAYTVNLAALGDAVGKSDEALKNSLKPIMELIAKIEQVNVASQGDEIG